MRRHVASHDPRKQAIVDALKAKTGASRVTNVYQLGENTFEGTCLKHSGEGFYQRMGRFTVEMRGTQEVGP